MGKTSIVSFLVITYNRKDYLSDTLRRILEQDYQPIEVLIVDNNSTDGTDRVVKTSYNQPFIKYIRLSENVGVAKARNVAIKNATGHITITLDDDALILGKDSTKKIVKKFESDKKIGVLAFKIVNNSTGKILTREFPHRNKSLDPDKEFETTYFIGAGHAIRKEVFDKVGPYMNSFYGMEELDLSYRILDMGYKIIYFPEVTVIHKRTEKARITEEWEHMLVNRMKMLYRNLPWRYVFTNMILWMGVALLKTKKLHILFTAFRNFLRDFESIKHQRNVLRPETIRKIRDLKGRLYY